MTERNPNMSVAFVMDKGPTLETYELIEANAENVRQAIRQTFFFMGRDLKQKISKDILDKTNKTGHIYVRRDKLGRRRRHQSSAPGETHANMTGELRESLGWKVHGTNSLEIGYGVEKPTVSYAEIEFGYFKEEWKVFIEARPSIKNNIENVSFETFFEKALDKIAR